MEEKSSRSPATSFELYKLTSRSKDNYFQSKVEKPKSSVALLSLVPNFKLHEQRVEAIFLVDCSGFSTFYNF